MSLWAVLAGQPEPNYMTNRVCRTDGAVSSGLLWKKSSGLAQSILSETWLSKYFHCMLNASLPCCTWGPIPLSSTTPRPPSFIPHAGSRKCAYKLWNLYTASVKSHTSCCRSFSSTSYVASSLPRLPVLFHSRVLSAPWGDNLMIGWTIWNRWP